MVLGAAAALGNLEIQILGLTPDLLNQRLWGWGLGLCAVRSNPQPRGILKVLKESH